ncbi:MAG: radical SAM protein [Candidatus Lernaella stagnicola]|nr:radical SAM protein [Candidatus Lernaella stagnicola]
MNVLLVNPTSLRDQRAGPYSKLMFPVAPLGLAYLAAVARDAGHNVRVEDQYASGCSASEIGALAAEHRADVVGFSCLSPNVLAVRENVAAVRERLPETHIVLGNMHAAYFAAEMLRDLPIDSVVVGEGENAFRMLLQKLAANEELAGTPGLAVRVGDEVVTRPTGDGVNPVEVPRPAWDLFHLPYYHCPPRFMMREVMLPVQAARGCPYNCAYCSQNMFHPTVRKRPLVEVVEEIAWLGEAFGVHGFGFTDSLFPFTEAEGLEFCHLLDARGLVGRVNWFTETRYDRMTPRLLREIKRCGCRFVMYGFETASRRLLEMMGKQVDPEQAFQTMRWTKEAGLGSYGLFMIGFPTETVAEAKETIRFARRLDCDVVSFARVTPYPGSRLYEDHKNSFPPDVQPWQWNNQYRPAVGETIWAMPGLSHEQITGLVRDAMVSYYLRPRIILRHLRRGTFSAPELATAAWSLLREMGGKVLGGFRRGKVSAAPRPE